MLEVLEKEKQSESSNAIFGVALFAAIGGLFLVKHLTSYGAKLLSLSTLINPASVAYVADRLPQDTEDDFIMAAWKAVGEEIAYDGYGSEIKIIGHNVLCERCLLPEEVIAAEKSNCVGKSVLLVSLLRNRLPPDRVYMGIGQLTAESVGGHAWAVCQRADNEWYLLEATLPPRGWKLADLQTEYHAEAFVNDVQVDCRSKELCVSVKRASCNCLLNR